MKILLVGAGAVGQVYGRHLAMGGAEVSFFVKKKYADECRRGFKLYPLNERQPRRAPIEFKGFGVLTELEEVRATAWDQVYLCMSSTALRGGWLEEFAKAVGSATIVTLQPGLDDHEYLRQYFSEPQIVSGMISLISYPAPLPGEKVPEPGMAYWFPPLSPSPFSGAAEATKSVVALLAKGKCPAVVHANVPKEVAFPSAALMTLLTALELSDWSFSKLAHNGSLPMACDATKEAADVISRKLQMRTPFALKFLKPTIICGMLKLAPRFVPLDLETYFRVHFTKVGDQTRLYMQGYIDHGKQLKLPVGALERLESKLRRSVASM